MILYIGDSILDAQVDRQKTPWVIVGYHRPLYIDDANIDPAPSGSMQVAAMLQEVG